jgi:integrase
MMNVKQNLSILFYLRRVKMDADGKVPVYVRLTIDGLKVNMSLGFKILVDNWDAKTKTVKCADSRHKTLNKKIGQVKTDLERHFDLMQAKHEEATPQLVLASYKTPISGQRIRQEEMENLAFSEELDALINCYILFTGKYTNAHKDGTVPDPMKRWLLEDQKAELNRQIEQLYQKSTGIFDKKEQGKTFIMAADEYLMNFLQLASVGQRSVNTLEKMIRRKRRFLEFLQYRYKTVDRPLQEMEYSFVEQLCNYMLVQKKVIQNTAMKYVQCVKEIMDRAVSKRWVASNPFTIFRCHYQDPHHDWLTMQELEKLFRYEFSNEKLNRIPDILVFSSFTGLSFQEVYTLRPADIMTGIDGKKWINKNRQKTGADETLPLLPLPLQLLEKYKTCPYCLTHNKLLPVPTNQEYNRCLKVIADITGIGIVLRTHKARFFFANEVTYNNGIPLKTVSRMLGQKSVKTTEIYVRANRQNISEEMEKVEKVLFTEEGDLKTAGKKNVDMAKIIKL